MKIVTPVFFAVLITACSPHEPARTEAARSAPVALKTVEVQEIDWPVTYEAPGTVRARTVATISSRLMGYIRELTVEPGSRVAAGQVLVTIDSRDLDAG